MADGDAELHLSGGDVGESNGLKGYVAEQIESTKRIADLE